MICRMYIQTKQSYRDVPHNAIWVLEQLLNSDWVYKLSKSPAVVAQ